MSILRPFRAVRPAEGLAPSIAALPYDVYTAEEARREVERLRRGAKGGEP